MIHTFVFLAYHVRVALQHDRRTALHPRGGFLYDNHVTCIVAFCLQPGLAGKLQKIRGDLFFMSRLARDFRDFVEY